MSRRRILVDTVARLERERFQPMEAEVCGIPPEPLTDDEVAEHVRVLLEALGDDPFLIDQADDRRA